MKKLIHRHIINLGLLLTVIANLMACDSPNTVTEPAASENKLTIITRPSKNTYIAQADGADGLAFQLINGYAKANKLKLDVIITENEDDIYAALDNGLADVGLIGHPLSISKQESYPQTQSYMDITTQLIYRHSTGKPSSFDDLVGKTILVQDNEQYREKYKFIKAHYSDIHWEFSSQPIEVLLGYVNTGKIDYTLVDSHEYTNLQSLYTKTRVAFDLYYPEPISLALSQSLSGELVENLELYIDNIKEDGTLDSLLERFYGHAEEVNPRGSMTFFKRVRTRLPHYQDLIEQIATEHDLDWRLLAAVAYQESHWNPHARSNTGVRGMMMLTKATAKDLGIKNRLDTEQSLRGGAVYLKQMMDRLPEDIKHPDRTWFALAAYNVGLGHILDAREITRFHGDNPARWSEVKQYLPLLEKKDWYEHTNYGFARGSEPVSYVQNIRHFSDLLEWRFPEKDFAPAKTNRIMVSELKDAIRDARARPKENSKKEAGLKLSSLIF